MDLQKAIRELYDEKRRLDELIATLEQYVRTKGDGVGKQKRGRKSMSPEERMQVSSRMRSYWAERRASS